MELEVQLLAKMLENRKMEVTFPGLNFTAEQILEARAVQALVQIRDILRDDALSDEDCFQKIEAIVQLFEDMGSDCGVRHDFG